MKSDIRTSSDIQTLVRTFYGKLTKDEVLAPKFAHVDWEHHLPIMFSFWESMLLGARTYQGNPLQQHIPLNLTSEHFSRWLSVWHETVDDLFSGDVATEAKMRAESIAGIFKYKLGL